MTDLRQPVAVLRLRNESVWRTLVAGGYVAWHGPLGALFEAYELDEGVRRSIATRLTSHGWWRGGELEGLILRLHQEGP